MKMGNIKSFFRVVLAALFGNLCVSQADAAVVVYPAPEGTALNKAFTVEVRQSGDTEWMPVDVYAVKVDKTEGVKHSAATVSMAYFDFDGKVDVRVTSNKLKVEEACVRPLSYAIPVDVKGNTFTISLDRPRNLSVEVNGEIFNNLQIFANPLDKNRPSDKELRKLKKDKKYHYYGPGYHNVGTLTLGSGETLRRVCSLRRPTAIPLYTTTITYDYHIPAGLPEEIDVRSLKQTGPLIFMTADGLTIEPLYDIHRERYGVYWKQ